MTGESEGHRRAHFMANFARRGVPTGSAPTSTPPCSPISISTFTGQTAGPSRFRAAPLPLRTDLLVVPVLRPAAAPLVPKPGPRALRCRAGRGAGGASPARAGRTAGFHPGRRPHTILLFGFAPRRAARGYEVADGGPPGRPPAARRRLSPSGGLRAVACARLARALRCAYALPRATARRRRPPSRSPSRCWSTRTMLERRALRDAATSRGHRLARDLANTPAADLCAASTWPGWRAGSAAAASRARARSSLPRAPAHGRASRFVRGIRRPPCFVGCSTSAAARRRVALVGKASPSTAAAFVRTPIRSAHTRMAARRVLA